MGIPKSNRPSCGTLQSHGNTAVEAVLLRRYYSAKCFYLSSCFSLLRDLYLVSLKAYGVVFFQQISPDMAKAPDLRFLSNRGLCHSIYRFFCVLFCRWGYMFTPSFYMQISYTQAQPPALAGWAVSVYFCWEYKLSDKSDRMLLIRTTWGNTALGLNTHQVIISIPRCRVSRSMAPVACAMAYPSASINKVVGREYMP